MTGQEAAEAAARSKKKREAKMLGKWKEIGGTFSAAEQRVICEKLRDGGISTKVKTFSGRERLADDVIFGAEPLISAGSGFRPGSEIGFRILVEKERWEEARYLLRQ